MSNWRHMMPTTEAYLLDKVLYQLHHNPDDLADYIRDKPAYLARFSLTPEMAAMICDNDVAGLYEAGVNPYLLRALHRRPDPGGRIARRAAFALEGRGRQNG